jgi:hypothetical protein
MSAGIFIGNVVLVLLGVSLTLIVWVILRLTVGGFWAFLGFCAILLTTVWGLFQLIP